MRLRRAARVAEVASDVAPVRREMESRLGPTLSRSRAAQVLGVSQTALDRWVAAGRIPVVLTPRGRREVPRQFVVELREAIDELLSKGVNRHVLARRSPSAVMPRKCSGARRRPRDGTPLHRLAATTPPSVAAASTTPSSPSASTSGCSKTRVRTSSGSLPAAIFGRATPSAGGCSSRGRLRRSRALSRRTPRMPGTCARTVRSPAVLNEQERLRIIETTR